MDKHVLITAGGMGLRFGSSPPKQFSPLLGKPLLVHALEAFVSYARDIHIVVVLPEAFHDHWQTACKEHKVLIKHRLALGGPTRFHSVKNGLRHIPGGALVAIHDGARPVVPKELISRLFHYATLFGNAIPVVPVEDSVRLAGHAMSKALDRETLRLVQTPQCFRSSLIKEAYQQNYHERFTDDASVLESRGERLFLVDGAKENIKVTTKTDLRVAEALLRNTGSEAGGAV